MEIHRDGYRDKKRKYRQTIAPFAVPYEGVKIHLMISFRYGITRISRKKNKENLCFPCNLCFREICVIPCLKNRKRILVLTYPLKSERGFWVCFSIAVLYFCCSFRCFRLCFCRQVAVNDSGTSKCCHSVYNGDDEEKEHCKSAACYVEDNHHKDIESQSQQE